MEPLRELHLFAGAGGGILGGMLLGHTCVCAVEIEPYCRKVLLQRQRDGILPKFPIWDDVKTFDGKPWRGLIDVVCGGFPCQDISVAGRGAGINGKRSGLWIEMSRIVGEIRPRFVFVENTPRLTILGLARVLADLSRMGFNTRHGVLGGFTAGLCVNGKRMWIIATTSDGSRRFAPQISIKIPNPEWTSRRQFERTISACASSEAHSKRLRDFDGLSRDMDRLKAIGNGQVPAVVKLTWQTLSGLPLTSSLTMEPTDAGETKEIIPSHFINVEEEKADL